MLSTKPILEFFEESQGLLSKDELVKIEEDVRTAAYKIIEAKRATYYGIGMSLTRITKAILGDESSVLTVSANLRGEYGQSNVYVGVPCLINKNGIQKIIEISLTPEEKKKFDLSCDTIRANFSEAHEEP